MAYDIKGNWKGGWALDLHTLSSTHNSDGSFNSVRSEIGEALFQLKYRQDYSKIDFLADKLVEFLKTRMVLPYINVIIPTPSSFTRDIQPVHEIAKKVSSKLSITYDETYVAKVKSTSQLKEIKDINERRELVKGAYAISNPTLYAGRKILIIDDLFRSGTTLNELTATLYRDGNVNNVYVVTLTKTRSNK